MLKLLRLRMKSKNVILEIYGKNEGVREIRFVFLETLTMECHPTQWD